MPRKTQAAIFIKTLAELLDEERETHPVTARHSFHVLLPQQAQSLRRRALKLTSNEQRVEDLVQDTLLKAWANRDRYRPDTQLRAWLFTIMRNTFFSDLRKLRPEVEDVDGACARALFEEPRQDHALALKELTSAIALLPYVQRRPLVLIGAYGFSQREAADACRCTVGTIKSRVSRGRAKLNRIMAHDEVVRSTQNLLPDLPTCHGAISRLWPSTESETCPDAKHIRTQISA